MENCVIGITIKNNEKYLPKVFDHLISLKTCFNKYSVQFIYDNNSPNTDSSLDLINKFKLNNTDIDINLIHNDNEYDYKNIPFERRVVHITNARNTLMRIIREKYASYKYFIMMDANYSCTEKIESINTDIINSYLIRHNEWDSLSFNRKVYYDIWALSLKPYITSYWHHIRENPFNKPRDKLPSITFSLIKKNFYRAINNIPKGELMEVDSAFCGFAIYKTNIFINSKYHYLMDLSLFDTDVLKTNMKILPFSKQIIHSPDCEHRYFHLYAKKYLGARIMMANIDIFNYIE
jgi:hypothetical protein